MTYEGRHRACPICLAVLGSTKFCPCCEQWNRGSDTDGRLRELVAA